MSLDIYLKCKCCKLAVHDQSTTHNLTTMAEAVGLYEPLWHPERLNIIKAKELIKPLKKGIRELKFNPAKFKKLEPDNKWGTYDDFVPWLVELFKACVRYPNTIIKVSV